MSYPTKILPQSSNRLIKCDLSDFYLIRSTNTDEISEILDSATQLVREKHICSPRENISDLSVSLLGVFEIEHTKIELTENGKKKYAKYCKPDIKVDIPKYHSDFIRNPKKHYWVLLIGDVNNTKVLYSKSNLPFEAECIVEHTPMMWNFWHFSVRWKVEEGFWNDLDIKDKKVLNRRLAHEARSHIKMFAKVIQPRYPQLDQSEYLKNSA